MACAALIPEKQDWNLDGGREASILPLKPDYIQTTGSHVGLFSTFLSSKTKLQMGSVGVSGFQEELIILERKVQGHFDHTLSVWLFSLLHG